MTRFSQRFRLTGGSEANSVNKWFGGGFAALSGAFESIQTVTVGSGGASFVEFTSIPATYTHLQVRFATISSGAASSCFTYINGDTTQANYECHVLYGEGGGSSGAGSYPNSYLPQFLGGAKTTSPGVYILDVLDYANTNKNKTLRALGGYDSNGSGYISLDTLVWLNTSAITSLKFSPNSNTWSEYAKVALYGIKGA